MVDARLPARWLQMMQFDALSDEAWRVFTGGLMWCVANGTDGHVPARYLKVLHPGGVKPAACRSRQKSLRGLAKWAFAAAETRPGLIPQKIAVSPRPRTSGTSLSGGFGFDP